MTHLKDGNWIQAQDRINSLLQSKDLSFIRIYTESDDLYGPIGKKKFLTECTDISYENFRIEACGQIIEEKGLVGFSISFVITLCLVFISLRLIKGHISKINRSELEQLKNLKKINVFNIESSSTYITEFIEIEAHIKKLVSSISNATRTIARSANARRLVHDLRMPLNQVIHDLLPNKKIDEARATLERIVQNAENNLSATISKSIPLSTISSELVNFTTQTQDKEVVLEIRNQIQEEVWIKLPPGVLEAALINFANNSKEAQPGLIKIELNVNLFSNKVVVEFLDNGPGFSADNLAHLNLGQAVKSNKTTGAGIGLSEIYKVLNESGSKITFSNQPQHGGQILITIPTFTIHPNSLKVWHIDDDKYVRNNWIQQSEKRGLKVFSISPEEYRKLPELDLGLDDVYFFDLNTFPKSGYEHARSLAEKGAHHLYITTAEDVLPETIPFYISGIIGKKAPWQKSV